MKSSIQDSFFIAFLAFVFLFVGINSALAQEQTGRGDTAKITIPAKESPFGLLEIPMELLNPDYVEGHKYAPMKRFELNKDYTKEMIKAGLIRPNIDLRMDFSSPKIDWHPALYALAIVAAFFNNRVTSIQEKQYRDIMNSIYGYPTPSSRYEVTQYNISRGIFGHSGISVSGFKVSEPQQRPYGKPVTEEKK